MKSQEPKLWRAAVLAFAGAWCGTVAHAQAGAEKEPAVTPYRPSVSTPAALSAPGWLEVEAGLLHARGTGISRRDSLPSTIKLAFSDDWGVRLGTDVLVRQREETGQRLSGWGDSSLVLKRRFAIDDFSAFGLELGATLATGRTGISSGKPDLSINGIYSADLGAYHTDLNLVLTRIGAVEAGAGRGQLLYAASVSRSLTERVGVVAELSGTRQRGARPAAQLLGALTYNATASMTIDAGVSRSIRAGPPQWSVFGGVSFLAGRLF